ncbi:MAG: rubredoxin [Gammaproteobacteria bacterium]|nr:MAG: rubredoxin [Gammaproteobacteria bacterium]
MVELKSVSSRQPLSGAAVLVCDNCGYVYDPSEGDPLSGLAAGISFDDLPHDWTCPECGASKALFLV